MDLSLFAFLVFFSAVMESEKWQNGTYPKPQKSVVG